MSNFNAPALYCPNNLVYPFPSNIDNNSLSLMTHHQPNIQHNNIMIYNPNVYQAFNYQQLLYNPYVNWHIPQQSLVQPVLPQYNYQYPNPQLQAILPQPSILQTLEQPRKTVTSQQQLAALERAFRRSRYITAKVRQELITALGMRESFVRSWFTMRRNMTNNNGTNKDK